MPGLRNKKISTIFSFLVTYLPYNAALRDFFEMQLTEKLKAQS
jgi:hypothetical protein